MTMNFCVNVIYYGYALARLARAHEIHVTDFGGFEVVPWLGWPAGGDWLHRSLEVVKLAA
jgi:hypothetical protein